MRIGVVARSEARGLAFQTLEVCRHLNPERVLLVEAKSNRHATNREWFDPWDTTVVTWAPDDAGEYRLPADTVRSWLAGLDAVYTAETPYDWRLPRWARHAGVRLVCHINPELLPPQAWNFADQVTWWAPTPWLLDRLPPGTKVVPMPVATDRVPQAPPREDRVRFVHVAGHQAMLDRNGTRLLSHAARRIHVPVALTVTGQDGHLPVFPARNRRIQLQCVPDGLPNYWDAYQGDVLVMPRRYGGLCLPAQEAMAAGMCVLMPSCPPNDFWPGPRFRTVGVVDHAMLGGQIPVFTPCQLALTAAINNLARDPGKVDAYQAEAREWAACHSWEALLPTWLAELGAARVG